MVGTVFDTPNLGSANFSGPELCSKPNRCGYRPVISPARDGEHTG
jgi:hypothetical protein